MNFLIQLLERMVQNLKNLQENNLNNLSEPHTTKELGLKMRIFYYILGFIPLGIFLVFFVIYIFETRDIKTSILIYSGIYLGVILPFMLHALYKNISKKYLFLIHFPLIISSFCIIWMINEKIHNWLFIIVLTGIFPLIFLFKHYIKIFKENKYLICIQKYAFNFNLAILFLFSVFTLIGMIFGTVSISNYGGIKAILLLYPIYSLHIYFDQKGITKKSLFVGFLLIFLLFPLSLLPQIPGYFAKSIVKSAEKHFANEGYNQESYDEINKFLLKHAYHSLIKNNRSYDRRVFQKVFDTTEIGLFGEKIAKYTGNRNSFATNTSKVGEEAEVLFTLAEIENNFIKSQSNTSQYMLETTYNFYFQNTTDENQEVIINFETPSKHTVITDLLLGLNGELIGQISPRGAAREVYERSLRRNIDPALIEKVGLNTYNMRIFPIPSKKVDQGKQKVVVKMVSPILGDNIISTPKFSLINLKFNENSRLSSTIYKADEIVKETIFSEKNKIEEFISQDQVLQLSEFGFPTIDSNTTSCIDPELFNLVRGKVNLEETYKKTENKTHIFFDNSLSTQRSKAYKMYPKILEGVKNYEGKLQNVKSYSHNFTVNKITDTDQIEYWGYSHIDTFIEYLHKNNIKNQRIIYVTDDDSYEYNTRQNNKEIFNAISNNKISVIKIGNDIKSYKSDFHTVLSATDGNIYEINSTKDIPYILKKILTQVDENILKYCHGNFYTSMKEKQIQAGYLSKKVLSKINKRDNSVPELQTKIAQKYHIVNQFNSIIALETAEQQRQLDSLSQKENKYELEYNTGNDFKKSSRISRNLSFGNNTVSGGRLRLNSVSTADVKGSYSNGYGSSDLFELNFNSLFSMIIFLLYITMFGNFLLKYYYRAWK
ncbi:MAG: hypothetical protein GY828_07035 [Candidatus Gracilibacteria bacterium]|nr:hypothetical protein [Candidatus Gracilibacteria bacterium]